MRKRSISFWGKTDAYNKTKKKQQTKIRPAPVESLPNLSSSKIFPPSNGSMLTLLFIRKINLHH